MKDTCLVKISLRLTSPEPLNMKNWRIFLKILLRCLISNCKKLLKGSKHLLISSEFDHNVKRKSKITKSIEEFLKSYKEEALEKSNGVKQTKMTTFFTIVEQNAEKTGPFDQKFSKLPLNNNLKAKKLHFFRKRGL